MSTATEEMNLTQIREWTKRDARLEWDRLRAESTTAAERDEIDAIFGRQIDNL